MAINKNFVIKNGAEINTNLFVADSSTNKIGIGTTVPQYSLHVGGSRGGIGATDITIVGVATVGTSSSESAAFSVLGVSTFQGDVNFLGSAGVSTITFDASLDKLNFADNARATFGASDDLQIFHDGSKSIIRETGTGNLVIEGTGETLAVFTDDGGVSLYYDNTDVFQTTPQGINVSGVTTSARLNVSGISTLDGGVVIGTATSIFANGNVAFAGLATANGGVQVGTAASIYTNGNIAAAGIVTANGGLAVGAAVTLAVNGNAAFAGIVTVGGDLKVTGDLEISEDLVLDTNLNILGVATIGNLHVTGIGTIDSDVRVGGASTFVEIAKFEDDLVVGVSTLFADVSTGFVGVGTSVPGFPLEVRVNSVKRLQVDATGASVTGVVTGTSGGSFAQIKVGQSDINTITGKGGSLNLDAGDGDGGIVNVNADVNLRLNHGLDVATGVSTFKNDLIVGVSTLFADVSTGRIGIGTAVPASTLDVDGALTVNSAKVEDLTDNRIVIAGTDGELEDSSNLTFDGSTLQSQVMKL